MSRHTLKLGANWSVPADAATESWGFLGQRGSGKSNAMVDLAEELHACGVPWVAIDPKGDWWGIRSSADGKEPGLPVPVFGGLHADVPLEPTSGSLVADLLFDNVLSAVLDISRLSVGNMSRFLIDFFHRMFDRHQADPQVRMMLLEEAHRYIPQSLTAKTAALKEAAAKIPLEGRAFGLGSATASQRSSRLHKDVLTQFSIMVAMRSPAKLDRDAIGGWVEEQEVSKDLLRDLPSLKNGEAWLWSPHALERAEKVMFRRRSTFDSGATPKVGQATRKPKTIADVDLGAITVAMAETVERAKENDPAELKRQIKDLQRQLAERPTEPVVQVEHVIPPRLIEISKSLLDSVSGHAEELRDELGKLLRHELDEEGTLAVREISDVRLESFGPIDHPTPNTAGKTGVVSPPRSAPQTRGQNRKIGDTGGHGDLTGPQRKLLTVLATYGPRSKTQLAMQAGYSANGGGFNNPLGQLRSAGYVEGIPIAITDAGLVALGDYPELPTGRELLAHWLGQLSGPAAKILATLVDNDGRLLRTELAEAAGYSPNGGGFNNPLGKLRTLQLVTRGDPVELTPEFAEAIA